MAAISRAAFLEAKRLCIFFGQQAKYMLALDAANLLDEKYADYTSGTTNKTYSPALPLSIYATFTVDY